MSDTNAPFPILGTAMWGWTIEKRTCFDLLDAFYQKGFREVDAATNYPINKIPSDFRKSESILKEWIDTHGVADLKVMMKVGSINNMRGPENNLSKSFLLMVLDEYRHLLGKNLDTFMIHWDNRSQKVDIQSTMEALQIATKEGIKAGISGIKYPDIYALVNEEIQLPLRIQIKHNLLHSDYQRYTSFHQRADFLCYGINAGGIKLDATAYHANSSLRARGGNTNDQPAIVEPLNQALQTFNEHSPIIKLSSFNQCGLIYACCHPDIKGVLIGTSRVSQLQETLAFMETIKQHDFSSFYQKLQQIAGTNAGS